MKKFMLITLAAALVAAAFVIAGCASSGGGGGATQVGGPVERKPWRISGTEGGIAARNNTVALRKGENFLYIYFPVIGAEFDKIQLDFTVTKPVDIKWQCVYHSGALWGTNEDIFEKDMTSGPIETDCLHLTEDWFNMTEYKSLPKSEINGICLRVIDNNGGASFTLTDIQFLGLEGEAPW